MCGSKRLYSIRRIEPMSPLVTTAHTHCAARDQTPAKRQMDKISTHRTSYALELLELNTSYESVMLQTRNK